MRSVPHEFDRLWGKEYKGKLADIRARPEVQAKNSQVNIRLFMCTV